MNTLMGIICTSLDCLHRWVLRGVVIEWGICGVQLLLRPANPLLIWPIGLLNFWEEGMFPFLNYNVLSEGIFPFLNYNVLSGLFGGVFSEGMFSFLDYNVLSGLFGGHLFWGFFVSFL